MASEVANRLAKKELDSWEWIEDCTCEADPDSTCWYHLTIDQRRGLRADRLARVIDAAHQRGMNVAEKIAEKCNASTVASSIRTAARKQTDG